MIIFYSFQSNYNELSVSMTCMWFSWRHKRYLLNHRVTNSIDRRVSHTPLHVWTEEVLSDWHNPRPSSAQPRLEAPTVVVAREVELARMIAKWRVRSKDTGEMMAGDRIKHTNHHCAYLILCVWKSILSSTYSPPILTLEPKKFCLTYKVSIFYI